MKIVIKRTSYDDIDYYKELKDFLIKNYKTFYATTKSDKYFCVEIEKKDLGKLMLDILDDTEIEKRTSELVFSADYFSHYYEELEGYYCLEIYDNFRE